MLVDGEWEGRKSRVWARAWSGSGCILGTRGMGCRVSRSTGSFLLRQKKGGVFFSLGLLMNRIFGMSAWLMLIRSFARKYIRL